MKFYLICLLVLISGLLTSCTHTEARSQKPIVAPPVANPAPVVTPPVVVEQPAPTPSQPPVVYPTKGWIPAYDDLVKAEVTERMLNAPNSRMTKFCDTWPTLTREQRKQMYADLVYAIAGPESAWNNLSAMVETTMGKDAMTGLPVVSEGMLQLSYQDGKWYGPKCKWDWPADKTKLMRDLATKQKDKKSFKAVAMDRSTLDPIRNITCGVAIMDFHLDRSSREFADSLGEYWFVMKRKNSAEYAQVWANFKTRNKLCK